jgi:hypothetical protein
VVTEALVAGKQMMRIMTTIGKGKEERTQLIERRDMTI